MNTRWIWRHSTATPFTASCSSRACLSLHDWDSSPLRSAAVSLNANQSQSMANDKRLLSCLTHTLMLILSRNTPDKRVFSFALLK